METKKRIYTLSKINVVLLLGMLLGFSIGSLLLPDAAVSKSERRKLAEPPEFSPETFFDGTYTSRLEEYLRDHFAGRDILRTVKAETEIAVFQKSDSGGYYKVGDAIYQRNDALQEKNVRWAAEHFAQIAENYFPDSDIYYAVIPNKEEYLQVHGDETAHEHGEGLSDREDDLPEKENAKESDLTDSEQAEIWMAECLPKASCISIRDVLSLEDYYRTDMHWRQECITDVADVLLTGMRDEAKESIDEDAVFEDSLTSEQTKIHAAELGSKKVGAENDIGLEVALENFRGGNACASAFEVEAETIYYVNSPTIEHAEVYDYEMQAQVPVYSWEKLKEGTDPYDFYLWGARALLTIKNPDAPEGVKQLLVFRDSFGSSVTPLLLEDYAQITLVDLRYVTLEYAAELLGEQNYDDVLFLYHTTMLNHSGSMRF